MAASSKKRNQTKKAQVNDVYDGVVVRLEEYGAYINVLPGKDGFLHISQIGDERPENVSDVLKEGQKVRARVLEIDRQGRIRLTMLSLDGEEEA